MANSTMMNRTMRPCSDEEQKLDDVIRSSLYGLLKMHPGSQEMHQIVSQPGIFSKENTFAFIHVTHYLFNLLDPQEFHKRFYNWPIRDKSDEGKYRSATVEYINALISNGVLKMQKIKANLVVHPGGVTFMNFLVEFMSFVFEELIKRKPVLIPEGDIVENLQKLGEKGAKLSKINAKVDKLLQDVESISKNELHAVDDMLKKVYGTSDVKEIKKHLENFAKSNDERFEKLQKDDEELFSLVDKFEETVKMLNDGEDTEAAAVDKVEINLKSLAELKAQLQESPVDENKAVDLSTLCDIFQPSLQKVEEIMAKYPIPTLEQVKADGKTLLGLCAKVIETNNETDRLRRVTQMMKKNNNEVIEDEDNIVDERIENMLLRTPDFQRKRLLIGNETINTEAAGISTRLALMDDKSKVALSKIQADRSKPKLERSTALKCSSINETFRLPLDSSNLLMKHRSSKKTNDKSQSSFVCQTPKFSSTLLDNSPALLSPEFVAVMKPKSPKLQETATNKTISFAIRQPGESPDLDISPSSYLKPRRSVNVTEQASSVDKPAEESSLNSCFSNMKLGSDLMDISDNVLVDDSF